MTARLPVAVIGCGSIGLRHAGVADQLAGVDLTGVVEPDPTWRAQLEALGYPAVAAQDQLPARTRAVIVATPTPLHENSGITALLNGWAVLVEKPVTGTLDSADRLCGMASSLNLPLIVGHHRRCHPFVAAARQKLQDIGDLIAVQGMWALRKHDSYYDVPWRRQVGAGPILTNLSHEVDLLRFLMGDITEVSAMTSNAARGLVIEDTAAIQLRFASGALGSFLLSDAAASPWAFEAATDENPDLGYSGQDCLHFTGTQGALSFPSLTLWKGADTGSVDWRKPLEAQTGPRFDTIDPIAAQMQRFADLVGGAQDPLLASGPDGRATLEATLAAALSGQRGVPVRIGDVPLGYGGTGAMADRG